MRNVFLIGILVLGAAVLAPAPAVAQQGPVDLDITLGSVTILHYFRNLDVTIDSTALTQMLGYGTNPVNEDPADPITISTWPFVGNANLQAHITDPTNDPAAVDLTIENAWSVRSNNANGTNTVTIAITNGLLTHTSGDTIAMSNGRVTVDLGTPGASVTFPSPGMANPQYGDVILELDL
ncbi:MAG: hypothetical protein C3F15_17245, partial [Holophagae bacterium]